jgi:hypothetical protein
MKKMKGTLILIRTQLKKQSYKDFENYQGGAMIKKKLLLETKQRMELQVNIWKLLDAMLIHFLTGDNGI